MAPSYEVELLAPAWLELDAIADYRMETVGPSSAQRITEKILATRYMSITSRRPRRTTRRYSNKIVAIHERHPENGCLLLCGFWGRRSYWLIISV